MPAVCAVYGCGSRRHSDGVRFCRIPQIKLHRGDHERELTEKRRRLWIAAIGGPVKDFGESASVCSRHFVSGKSAGNWETSSVDWVPTLCLGADDGLRLRYGRAKKRGIVPHEINADDVAQKRKCSQPVKTVRHLLQILRNQPNEVNEPHHDTGNARPNFQDVMSQTHLTGQVSHIVNQDEHISRLRDQAELTRSVSQASLAGNDEQVRYYTGLPTYTIVVAIFNLVSPNIDVTHRSAMSKFQQMMIVLMRLKLNLSECDLAYRFDVAQSTISRVFKLTLDVLFTRLNHFILWPEREELRLAMPMQFREHFGKRVAVIIDCFEIFIDRPPNLSAGAQTCSNYKHHSTIKYLIGITPQGAISYLSNAWGGKISDKHIIEDCGVLMKLEPGDLVLADCGFDIAESVGMQCAEVKPPAFTGGKKQLAPAEIKVTSNIAHVRSHVQRCIGNVRKKYGILGGQIPVDYLETKDSQGWTTMDKIARLSCALTNLSNSVVSLN
ncbi:uncharacterized protein LOC119738024 [Patiria miniata]|uniref:THAP-type domain-containing protein n=1 Tax=Patiria miniata TaxID=46514 RepID=A0A914AY87_PATMI|nr:uncharacterized protein LOC119738024 [Patiria miniata]